MILFNLYHTSTLNGGLRLPWSKLHWPLRRQMPRTCCPRSQLGQQQYLHSTNKAVAK